MTRVVEEVRVELLCEVRLVNGPLLRTPGHPRHVRIARVAGEEALVARDVRGALVRALVEGAFDDGHLIQVRVEPVSWVRAVLPVELVVASEHLSVADACGRIRYLIRWAMLPMVHGSSHRTVIVHRM